MLTSSLKIRSTFQDYDICIGTGITPALFKKAKLQLDIFIPYSTGFEYVSWAASFKNKSPIYSILYGKIVKVFQIKGMKSATYIIAPTYDKLTKSVLKKYNITNVLNWWFPMLYINKNISIPEKLNPIFEQHIQNKDFVLFSHTRHWWRHPHGKKNDLPIKAYAKFLKKTRFKAPILFLMEYGVDVPHTKVLISKLNIERYVVWLPQMKRKDIMPLLNKVDLGFAEFHTGLWGGVTWEFLASGVPNINKIGAIAKQVMLQHNTKLPPIVNASTESEILNIYLDYEKNPKKYKCIGRESKKWFDEMQGLKLSIKYKALINELYQKKKQVSIVSQGVNI